MTGVPPSGSAALEEIVRRLDGCDRQIILSTPLQYPASASHIARLSGLHNRALIVGLARRRPGFFQRLPNENGRAWEYRLSPLGARIRESLVATASGIETRQGGDPVEGRRAEHESPTGEAGDAQTEPSND